MVRITWLKPEERFAHELVQLAEEGVDASALERRWREAESTLTPAERRALAVDLLDEARTLSVQEPSAHLPPEANAARATPFGGSEAELYDRILGCWTGRMAGCLLGKPVEKVPREGIRALLESAGAWPLTDYFSAEGVAPEVVERYPWNRGSRETSLRETIVCMPEDDDINYTMLNLHVLESYGETFTSDDVATVWLRMMPALTVFTAERVAYVNLLAYLEPPATAHHHNPYREWIGAQIRADIWGLVSPGDPAKAAELAWRDARLSHTENGVYGEMFVAAMVAAAFVEDDPAAVVRRALEVVPASSRLAEAIRFALELPTRTADWEEAVDALVERYGHYHWVHTINNAALLTAALLYGGGDFERTVTYAVMGGWDTDCNGASGGSIVGVMGGSAAVPARWSEPLANRVRTSLKGFDGVRIDALAQRTLALVPARYHPKGG